MTVAFHINITRKNAYEVAVKVYRKLISLGVNVIVIDDVRDSFDLADAVFLPIDEAVSACDVLVAVGGDGTIIHSAHIAAVYDKPILGINAGRLGFLAGIEKEELDLLSNLIDGNYLIDNRMMLSVKRYENREFVKEYLCLNDVVVARGASMHMCEIEAECSGHIISSYFSDGLIVATPTGSTAYSLSAGGPVVDTSIEGLIMTPVCPHSILTRSMIFKADSEIGISVKNSEVSLPIFSCDGEDGISMNNRTRLCITKSEKATRIIRIKSESFSDILTRKLIERNGF
ncbi:MAG: NAD(+)/NADH kinase [Ruminococcaceae bacterium]|nr:NAD(+)/NADH kinase [Oscillospiraceae bacterium]